jgi:diguanylate cyclase
LFYNQKLLERLYYESKINNQTTRALQDDEFKLYLQPKFEIPSLRIVGAEALVRWHDANGNVLFPDDFIPLFEQNGFIHELDFYMLENVCKFIKDNHLENTNFRISVNFSRVTILHQDFSKELKEMIQKYNVPTHCIELEITESVFYDFSKHTIEMIHELNNEGYVFSMDDFGSGYSSLNSIHTIPVDIIKIDRKFLKESHVSKQVVSIIRLIIETAHLLGKEIICEGVELSSDVELLNELNCHLGQGYYISKPVIKEDFTTLFLTETESKRKKLY